MFSGHGNRFIPLALLAIFLSSQSFSQDRPYSIRSIVTELRAAKLDDVAVEVPLNVATNLTALKRELRSQIVKTAESSPVTALTPEALSAEVIRHLEDQDVPVGDAFSDYGAINSVTFERPKEYPGWLIARTSLSIPYGEDISLYVFEIQDSHWKHAMTVEANRYKWISEAQGFMEHRVLRTSPGTPYLITTEISPSAASVWQQLRLRILRPGMRPQRPLVLAKKNVTYCLDEPYYFSMRKNGFGLMYLGDVVDHELVGYRGVRYLDASINQDKVVFRQKATDPSNLINRWISEPWSTASRRVLPPNAPEIEKWHQRFQKENWVCDAGPLTPYEHNNQLLAVTTCATINNSAKAYVVITPAEIGFLISSITTQWPADEPQGRNIYAGGVTPPVVESSIHPKLPPGQTAPAKLRMTLTVDEKGSVTSAGFLDWPAERAGLAVPALRAVRQWKFSPGMDGKTPVESSTEVEVVFQP